MSDGQHQGDDALVGMRLRAVLAEYRALRTELLQKFRHHLQLFSIATTGMTVVIGWALTSAEYDILLGVPVLATAFGLRYLWEQSVIATIGKYLRRMEEHSLPTLIGVSTGSADTSDGLWVGWEHFWRIHAPPLVWFKVAVMILFIVVPFVPAIVFAATVLLQNDRGAEVAVRTGLPVFVHAIAAPSYLGLGAWLSQRLWRA